MGVMILAGGCALDQEAFGAKQKQKSDSIPVKKKAAEKNGENEKKTPTTEDKLNVARQLKNSFVVVEFSLKYDKGQSPPARGKYINEERPKEIAGFLLSPTEVIAYDLLIHPRFIKSINVRFADQLVAAAITSYARNQDAIYLSLEKPLTDTKPLKFIKALRKPYLYARYRINNGQWGTVVGPLGGYVAVSKRQSYRGLASGTLITNSEGKPVGMRMSNNMSADDSWKGSPKDWPQVSQKKMDEELAALKKNFDNTVVRVALSFRSPKKNINGRMRSRGEDNDTEQNAVGVIYANNRILIMKYLRPKVTARLEKIVLYFPNGNKVPEKAGPATKSAAVKKTVKKVPAKFLCTLKDYGAFVATLDEPAADVMKVSDEIIIDLEDKLLLSAEVKMRGEKVVAYFDHNRIYSYFIGWKRRLFPKISHDSDDNIMIFTQDGKLVAFPIARRKKISGGSKEPVLTPVGHLGEILRAADMASFSDPSNVPLAAEEENRLAWLGTVLQPLTGELARINNVAEVTQNGKFGALVAYIYPESPAAKAEIEVGDVLVRIHSREQPKPINIEVREYSFGGRLFPWQHYDRISEQYYDKIPSPFPPTENRLSRKLTDLGFGKKFEIEFYRDGQRMTKDFTVTQSPPYYLSAPQYKAKELGLTVRGMTYEVRRYFQKKPKDPGVIVSRIEPGSKASVAGIKPYELIISVNGADVMDVEEFEKLIGQPGDLRLFVKRMHKGRIVKIRREVPKKATEKAPKKANPADEKK